MQTMAVMLFKQWHAAMQRHEKFAETGDDHSCEGVEIEMDEYADKLEVEYGITDCEPVDAGKAEGRTLAFPAYDPVVLSVVRPIGRKLTSSDVSALVNIYGIDYVIVRK